MISVSKPVAWLPFVERTQYWRRVAWLYFEIGFACGGIGDFIVGSFMHCLKWDIREVGDSVTYYKERGEND